MGIEFKKTKAMPKPFTFLMLFSIITSLLFTSASAKVEVKYIRHLEGARFLQQRNSRVLTSFLEDLERDAVEVIRMEKQLRRRVNRLVVRSETNDGFLRKLKRAANNKPKLPATKDSKPPMSS